MINHMNFSFVNFSQQLTFVIFHWNLSDSKSPQLSRTLQSILADLNNAEFWMVSSRLLISKSSSPLQKLSFYHFIH